MDSEGRPVMVIVGAHFLLRCLDLERFVLYVVKVLCLSLNLKEYTVLLTRLLLASSLVSLVHFQIFIKMLSVI